MSSNYPKIQRLHILHVRSYGTITRREVPVQLAAISYEAIPLHGQHGGNFTDRGVKYGTSHAILNFRVGDVVLCIAI